MARQADQKTFEKGMFPQLGAISLPKGSYLDALNMYREEDGGLTKEPGALIMDYSVVHNGVDVTYDNVLISNTLQGTIVGQFVFEDVIYYALFYNGFGRIVSLSKGDVLSTVSSTTDIFTSTSKVRMEGKIDYKGDVTLYIAGSGVDLSKCYTDTGEIVPLIDDFILPIITDIDESSGGSVPTGNYQFFVRYVTGSGNTTQASAPSFWYPVIPTDLSTSTMKDLRGAPPQTPTSKRLIVSVTDLDLRYDAIEVIVATYEGEENVLSAYSLGEKSITGESIDFTFSGTSDYLEGILLSELNTSTIVYNQAETIAQKDSTLILGGLTVVEQEFDWQLDFANKIKIQPVVSGKFNNTTYSPEVYRTHNGEEESFYDLPDTRYNAATGPNTQFNVKYDSAQLGGYAIPKNNKYKGYRYNEVYSFAVVPVFHDGTEGDAFHVPGLPVNILGTSREVTGTETYVLCDNAKYGEEFGQLLEGQPVSYHRMGGLDVNLDVNVGLDVDTSNTNIAWKDYAVGFKVVREDRKGFETKKFDCLASSLLKNRAQDYDRVLPYGVGEIKHGYFNNLSLEPRILDVDAYPTHELYPFTDDSPTHLTDAYDRKALSIFSPDYLQDKSLISGVSTIEEVEIINPAKLCANTTPNIVRQSCRGFYNATHVDTTNSYVFADPVKISNYVELAARGSFGDQRTDSDDVKSLQDTVTIFGNRNLISSARPDTLIIETIEDVTTEHYSLGSNVDFGLFTHTIPEESSLSNGNGETSIAAPFVTSDLDTRLPIQLGSKLKRFVLGADRPDYYGDVVNKQYQFVHYIKAEDTIETIYGGDTYTTPYNMLVPFYGKLNISELDGVYAEPWGSTSIIMQVQSYNNYFFRHQYSSGDVSGPINYPTTKLVETDNIGGDQSSGETGLVNIATGIGQNTQFNTQYSANNVLRVSFLSDESTKVYKFPARVAYSNTQSSDSVVDAYQVFLSDNYHDIPKDSGSITALNVVGNELYISTERKLWKAFYNALVTQATSEGDVVLGNGGAFNRPSIPVMDVNGGYAGAPSQEATVVTPFGMFLYDNNRHKLFIVSGNGLQEVTNPGMFNAFKELDLTSVMLGYDHSLKRVVLSSLEETYSYQPELKSFTARHSYRSSYLASLGVNTYMVKRDTAEIGKFSDSITQSFFGEIAKASIRTCCIVHPGISKRFVGIDAVTTSKNLVTGKPLPLNFFNTMKCYSDERNTGISLLEVLQGYDAELPVLGKIKVSKANNKFRMTVPPDVVNDIYEDIHDEQNLVTDTSFSDEDRMFRPDMTDTHMVIEFEVTEDNTESNISLSSLIVNFVKNNT